MSNKGHPQRDSDLDTISLGSEQDTNSDNEFPFENHTVERTAPDAVETSTFQTTKVVKRRYNYVNRKKKSNKTRRASEWRAFLETMPEPKLRATNCC